MTCHKTGKIFAVVVIVDWGMLPLVLTDADRLRILSKKIELLKKRGRYCVQVETNAKDSLKLRGMSSFLADISRTIS
jgi:hypothetical protein